MSEYLSAADGQVHTPTGVYPLNWNSNPQPNNKLNIPNVSDNTEEGNIYPDFSVWNQNPEDDNIMKSHLQKGYMEPQYVKHEDQSGRQLITELLNRSNTQSQLTQQEKDKKLELMGKVFIDAMHKRRVFNSVKSKGNYKPPPRVTLTEHKKDAWLKKLANPNIPLQELSRAIPHGLRNKILLEQCLNHQIPISRAIWLIKCISTNEQRQLKRKTTNVSTMNLNANKWIVEWTEQITSFFESIIENCFNPSIPKENWRFRLNYTIELIVNLYSEELMNQITFLTWIVRYISNIVNTATSFTDLKPIVIHQIVIKLFWFKIIRFDYLTKELSETMLLTLMKTNNLSKQSKFDTLAQKINNIFQYLIKYLFYYNSDIFILPSNWNYLKPYLRKVLDMNLAPVSDQFKLIAYRNESLAIDESDRLVSNSGNRNNSLSSNVISNDKFSLVLYKLNNHNNRKESIASLSKLIFEDLYPSESSKWKSYISLIFKWCIQAVRQKTVNLERITLISSVLHFRQSQLIQSKSKKFKQWKADLENTITDFVYSMSEILNYHNKNNPKGDFYDVDMFLSLISRLYNLKLFIVSSYLRRLIASGVIYLSDPDRTCYIHILILNLLPSSNDSNLKSILKRLTDSTKITLIKFDMDSMKTVKLNFLKSLFTNSTIDSNFIAQCYTPGEIDNPAQVGEHIRLSEYFYQQFDLLCKCFKGRLTLTYNKLIVLYEAFEFHYLGLSKFLIHIIDMLDEENSRIEFENDETFVLLLKMLLLNENLLNNSILNQKLSLWDHCLNVLKSWIDTNRYNIIENLHNVQLSKDLLYQFGSKNESLIEYAKTETRFLTQDELETLDLASYERLSNAAEFFHYTTLAITRYSNAIREGDESVNITLITKFLKTLQKWKTEEFTKCLCDYLFRYLKPTLQLDYDSNVKLLLRLTVDNFLTITKLVEIFRNKSTSNFLFETNNDNIYILWDIFFNSRYEFNFEFRFLYRYLKNVYISDHPNEFYKILSQIIYSSFHKSYNSKPNNDGMVDVANSVGVESVDNVRVGPAGVGVDVDVSVNHSVGVDVMDTFHDLNTHEENNVYPLVSEKMLNGNVIDSFWELITSYADLFIEYFYIPNEESCLIDFSNLRKFVFNKLLNVQVYEEIDEVKILGTLNYFNLQVLQWIFSYLIREKYDNSMKGIDIQNKFVDLIENILTIVEKENINDLLVGELFTFLPDNFKHQILSSCEQVYLNSDNFPRVLIEGVNTTSSLNCIISSCSRLNENTHKHKGLEMSDALVFSLNFALEKLINICHNLDHHQKKRSTKCHGMTKELELGIKMVSKIILLHKYFLVELILKRSVSLQRDVLILNLLKLFNHKVMVKNPKLKNLLYDVLISIKVIISESITQQFQSNQANTTMNTHTNITSMNSPGVWIGKGATPTSTSFFSPSNSPKPPSTNLGGNIGSNIRVSTSPLTNVNIDYNLDSKPDDGGKMGKSNEDNQNKLSIMNSSELGIKSKSKLSHRLTNSMSTNKQLSNITNNGGSNAGTSYIIMPNILNIKPPSFNNNLKNLLSMFDLKDTIPEKNIRYYTVSERWDGAVNDEEIISKYNSKPFELIEDSCPRYAMDDCAIGLQMFGVSAKRENPP